MVKNLAFCTRCFLCFLFSSAHLLGQNSGSAVPFMLITPSPEVTMVGGAGVALPNYSAMNFHANPALLGWSAQSSNLAVTVPSDMDLWGGAFGNLPLSGVAVRVGYNADSMGLPLSFGIGVLHQHIDLGTFMRTDDNGQVIGTFSSQEGATSIGAGVNYHLPSIDIALGVSVKPVYSDLQALAQSGQSPGEAKSTAFDGGIFVRYTPLPHLHFGIFKPILALNLGYTLANVGSKVVYRTESDPLPRMERLGYALQAGTMIEFGGKKFSLVQVDWSVETMYSLVRRDAWGSDYASVFSNSDVVDNLILLKNSPYTEVRYGARVNLLQLVSYGVGSALYAKPVPVDPVPQNLLSPTGYETWGYGLQLRGVLNLLSAFMPGKTLSYIAEHFDVQYHYASSKLNEMYTRDFHSFSLVISDIRL